MSPDAMMSPIICAQQLPHVSPVLLVFYPSQALDADQRGYICEPPSPLASAEFGERDLGRAVERENAERSEPLFSAPSPGAGWSWLCPSRKGLAPVGWSSVLGAHLRTPQFPVPSGGDRALL